MATPQPGPPASSPRHRRLALGWLVWLPLALGPLLLLGPGILRGEVLFWGTPLLQFVPWRQLGFDLIRQGQLPLWNPLLGAGAPLLANYQSALLYPPNWLGLLGGLPAVQMLLVMGHWSLTAAGMARLARGLGLDRWPSTIAGLAFGLSGYVVARAGFFSINAAVAWTPWIVWGVDRLCQPHLTSQGRRNAACLLTLMVTAQWLAGHAQTSWYTLLLAAAWAAWRLLGSIGSWRRRSQLIGWLALPLGLAFLLSAPQLLPTLEYLGQSQRAASVERELGLTYSFWPWRLIELVAPGAFGQPATGNYLGYGNYWEDALHLGVLPLLLALAGALVSWRNRSPHAAAGRFASILGVVGFLFGLGWFTPIYPWLYDHVPTFALFQAPTRWNLWLVFALALLAGIGAQAWRPATGRQLYWLRLGTAGAAAVCGGALLAWRLLPAVRSSLLTAFGLAGAWLLLAGVLALTLARPARRWWSWAVLAVVTLNLVVSGYGLNPTTSPQVYSDQPVFGGMASTSGRVYMPPSLEDMLKFERFFRFDSFKAVDDWLVVRQAGLPNTLVLEGVPSLNNFDPLVPSRYRTWLTWLEGLPFERRQEVLKYAGVAAMAQTPGPAEGEIEYIALAAERAWFVPQAHWAVDGPRSLALLASLDLDLASGVVLEGQSGPAGEQAGSGRVAGLEQTAGGQVRLEVVADTAGWLVLADTHFPGWQATIDGDPVEIFPANYLFRAVPVPAGSHQVEFRYGPASFRLGLVLFGIGLVALLGLALWARRDP